MKRKICYSDLPLVSKDPLKNVHDLIEYGADKVELLMDGEKWDDMEKSFKKLSSKLKELPIGYTIHPPAWDINLTSENKAIREASFFEYKKAIEFAGMIQASHVVIHPGFCFSPVFDKRLAKQRAEDYIHQLCEFAKPLNVKLAIENVGYNGSSIFTQDEFISFLENIHDTAGYLLDIGHANLNRWDIPQIMKQTKDRLIALHVHDNNGTGDDHLPIGEGTVPWQEIFKTIHEQSIDCQLILEYAPGTPLEKLREGKEILLKELSTE